MLLYHLIQYKFLVTCLNEIYIKQQKYTLLRVLLLRQRLINDHKTLHSQLRHALSFTTLYWFKPIIMLFTILKEQILKKI